MICNESREGLTCQRSGPHQMHLVNKPVASGYVSEPVEWPNENYLPPVDQALQARQARSVIRGIARQLNRRPR